MTISAVELNGYACTFVIDMVGTGNKHYIDISNYTVLWIGFDHITRLYGYVLTTYTMQHNLICSEGLTCIFFKINGIDEVVIPALLSSAE